jgi:hypothetical protein
MSLFVSLVVLVGPTFVLITNKNLHIVLSGAFFLAIVHFIKASNVSMSKLVEFIFLEM